MGESTKKFQDFIGKACAQHHIFNRRSRPFLQRNINAVLDAHERLLPLLARTATDESNSELEMLLATDRPRSGWDYPTPKMLEELVLGSANAPVLRLSELQLRLRRGSNSTVWRERRRDQGAAAEPSWLPSSGQDFTRPCTIEVIVQDSEARREVFKSSQQAVISGCRDESNELFFNVKLDDPFRISLQQLFVAVSHGQTGEGGARWKRTTSKKYRLTVALKCNNSADHTALLALLEPSLPVFSHVNADAALIQADWHDLPKCPEEGTLLQLGRSSSASDAPHPYGMEINLGWASLKGSVLERYGAQLQQQSKKDARQLLTPSASDSEKDRVSTRHTIRYEFDEGLYKRVFVTDNLKCLFCGGMSDTRAAIVYPHIARLYLHYLRQHDHFKFDLIQDDHLPEGHVARFLLTQNDKPDQVDDNNGYYRAEAFGEQHSYNVRQNWVAPRRPFDINAYTEGDESWTHEAHKQGKGKRPANGAKQARAGATATQSIKLVKRPPLEEIQDLPPHKRRRYMVPDIPGVTFYHTSSKHPAERHDYFSEEDDELEEQRLVHSQRRNFAEHRLDSVAIAFHEAFNAHMDREQSGPQILIRDGLVRFARNHHERMNFSQSRWRSLFQEKLQVLLSQRVITQETASFCLDNILALVEQPITNGQDQLKAQGASSLSTQVNGHSPALLRSPAERAPSASATADQSPGKPKTHKWSGGGADRDIIESGGFALNTGSRASRSSYGQAETPLEVPETPEGAAQPGVTHNSPNEARRDRLLHGHPVDKGEGVDRPYLNGIQHPSRSRAKRPCVCGKVAESQSMRGITSCDNTLCGRDYHIACVGLEGPIIGWRCPDCIASTSFRKPDVTRLVNGSSHSDKTFRVPQLGQAV